MSQDAITLQISTIVGNHPVLTKSVRDVQAAAEFVGGLVGPDGLSDPGGYRWRLIGVGLDVLYDIMAALAMFVEMGAVTD